LFAEIHEVIRKTVDLIPILFKEAKSQALYCFLFYFKCPAFVLLSVCGGQQTENKSYLRNKGKNVWPIYTVHYRF